MWYEIDLAKLEAKIASIELQIRVLTDGAKAFIWVEWDDAMKVYNVKYMDPVFSQPLFFASVNHPETGSMSLGVISGSQVFHLGDLEVCHSPKTRNVYDEFVPNEIGPEYKVLGVDGNVYVVSVSEDVRYLYSLFTWGDEKVHKFDDFNGYCRMARFKVI